MCVLLAYNPSSVFPGVRLENVLSVCSQVKSIALFLKVIWNRLYNPDSFCEKGTMKQLANLLNRSTIPRKVKNDSTAVQDFFDIMLDAHITSAALKLFGVKDLDDKPVQHLFEGDLHC